MRSTRKVLKYNKSRTIQDRENDIETLLTQNTSKGEKMTEVAEKKPEEFTNKVYDDRELRINILNKASASFKRISLNKITFSLN